MVSVSLCSNGDNGRDLLGGCDSGCHGCCMDPFLRGWRLGTGPPVPEARGPSGTLSAVFRDCPGVWALRGSGAVVTVLPGGSFHLSPHSCAVYLGTELRPGKSRPDYLFDILVRLGGGFVNKVGEALLTTPYPLRPGCGALAIPWDSTKPSWPWQLS